MASLLQCVVQVDTGVVVYSACVECAEESFQSECIYMSDDFLVAAEGACDESCALRCPEGTCADSTKTCVTDAQSDRCYDCSSDDAFQAQCYGDQDDMIVAAEAKCGFDCEDRCPNHKDSDCAGDEKCVVQANGLFDQCVDCDPASFAYNCKFW